jgi:hypothetical protein
MKVFAQRTLGAKMYLLGGLSIISGIAIAVKPIYKDAVFKEAIVMRNSSRIEMAANSFPRHGFYFNLASRYFRENKQDLEALEMSRLAIELNVRDFDAYMNIVVNPLASNIEKRVAFEKLKELDPFNENLIEEPRINRGN